VIDTDTSQRVSAEQLHAQRLAALESASTAQAKEVSDLRLHRERMETRWGLITAVCGALGVLALLSAFVTRDTVRDSAARITAVEEAQRVALSDKRDDQRAALETHDALVRLTARIEALGAQVEGLTSELRARDSAAASARMPTR